VDPADPYQKRAAAVGLHPKLSRVLLARLSATDYRNAGVAIETAVAKTPDIATFVWPRQRTPELELFQHLFVPVSAPHGRAGAVPSPLLAGSGAALSQLRRDGVQGPLVDDGRADGKMRFERGIRQ